MAVSEEEVSLGAANTEGFGKDVQRLVAYLYANGGIIVLAQATRLQRDFDTLMELFDRVGLRTNVAKTVSISF